MQHTDSRQANKEKMMGEYTKGPWGVTDLCSNYHFSVVRIGSLDINVQTEANAHLIAAAPCLLEALNNILVGMEASGGWVGDDGLFDAGMKAVRKALGEQP